MVEAQSTQTVSPPPNGAGASAPLPATVPSRRLAEFFARVGDGEVDRKLAERRAAGIEVINLAIVEPELPPPPIAIAQLRAAAEPHIVRGAGGVPEFRSAVARWYHTRFKTSLDPNREVLPLPSVEDGIIGLAQALLNPGDIVLVPDPARPIYRLAASIVGAEVVSLPLRPEQDFLPELKAITEETAARAKLLWLDYPNVPTGAAAPAAFFHQVVQFGQEHGVLVVHAADFSEFVYDGYRSISLLEIPGSRRVCVELHSPARTFNLPGWPVATAVGNADVLRLLRQLRQQTQSLSFVPAQRALAATLLQTGSDWLAQRNAVYQGRRDHAIPLLERLGLHVRRPKAVPALWAGVPSGYTSMEIADLLLAQAGIWVAPGSAFGPRGEGYVRMSLTIEEGRFAEVLRRLGGVVIQPRDAPAEREEQESAEQEPSLPQREEHDDAC